MSKKQETINIAIAGRTNAGKSSLLNLLSGQKDFSLTDPQPGTTADTVISRMEIHGLGSVKVFDTAGADEYSALGEKKRKKAYMAIEESDIVLLVIDLFKSSDFKNFDIEKEIIKIAKESNKKILGVYNIINESDKSSIEKISDNLNGYLNLKSLTINILKKQEQKRIIEFIKSNYDNNLSEIDLLPVKGKKGLILLNIPMDEETPSARLLRPQDMAVEHLLRKFLTPVLYRMDLRKMRSKDKNENRRFTDLINYLQKHPEGLNLVITDSQAMDVVSKALPQNIPLTTFSVMMANYMNNGDLKTFLDSLAIFKKLKNGDEILIAESCNHDRKCNDIGTKQIPKLLKEKLGLRLKISFSFGRTLPEKLSRYKIIIHCGGCMADRQKYIRRIDKIKKAGVPVTNYGLFLSWINKPDLADKVSFIFKK